MTSSTSTVGLHNPNFPDWITEPGKDTRNVIDYYKGWSDTAIRDDVASKVFPLVVVLENFASDYNLATAGRSANAFGASKVIIVGRRRWDCRGAVGVHHYTPFEHCDDPIALYEQHRADGYEIVACDNIEGAIPLDDHSWNPKTLLVFGQESIGVSNLTLGCVDKAVYIRQYGTVRSLNVGTAAGIIMHSYASATAATR